MVSLVDLESSCSVWVLDGVIVLWFWAKYLMQCSLQPRVLKIVTGLLCEGNLKTCKRGQTGKAN